MNRISANFLRLTAAGLISLAAVEQYRGEAYFATPHEKAEGVSTIGFGDAQGVKPGQKTDPVRALIRLGQQVSAFERQMHACIGDVPLHQHEWDAYVHLTFNIGAGKEGVKDGFCYVKRGGNSTIVRRLKAGDYKGACEGIMAWNKQNGKEVRGLTIRRAKERDECLGLKP